MHCLYCGKLITTTTYPGYGTIYIHEGTGARHCDLVAPVASPRLDFS